MYGRVHMGTTCGPICGTTGELANVIINHAHRLCLSPSAHKMTFDSLNLIYVFFPYDKGHDHGYGYGIYAMFGLVFFYNEYQIVKYSF